MDSYFEVGPVVLALGLDVDGDNHPLEHLVCHRLSLVDVYLQELLVVDRFGDLYPPLAV